MKSKFLLLLLVLLAVMMLAPAGVRAANDDFAVSYSFYPDRVGYKGADVALTLTVTNEGTTNITWVDVVVNTHTAFSERWTATINPGHDRAYVFTIPFEPEDLDNDKILQVAINNDGDTNPDGVQMFHFEIESTTNILTVVEERSPDSDFYLPEDMVTFTHRITNNMTTHAATGFTLEADLMRGSEMIAAMMTAGGNIFPGDTKSGNFEFMFGEDMVGILHWRCKLSYTMMGRSYVETCDLPSFEVNYLAVMEVPPDVEFTAGLRADRSEISTGDTVTFSVDIENTGDDAIGGFDIRNAEGGLEASTESLPVGGSGTVTLSVPVYETCTVSYTVVGRTEDTEVSHETNSMTITVREPETPAPTPSPAASDAAGLVSPSASVSQSPTISPTAAPSISPTPSSIQEEMGASTGGGGNTALMYILLGFAGLLMLAAIVLVIMLVKRKQKGIKDEPPEGDSQG
jgi:hypothetical protein